MRNETAALARSITRSSSMQSYITARLLVDRDLVDDCCRAYGYFRWADDMVDETCCSKDGCVSFIRRQRELIDQLYRGGRPDDLAPEEAIIADLISHDQGENSGLQSFIRNFLAIIEFDAHRRGRFVTQQELTWYSSCLGRAVTDAIQYFIGNGHPYPTGNVHYLAAAAAHITHMLRDLVQDAAKGYINVPREYLEAHGIGPEDVNGPPIQAWVRERVLLARQYFCEGKRYIDGLEVLRCKIAAHWYCARFEGLLDIIEEDGYLLRAKYDGQRKLFSWLRMAALAVAISLQHVAQRVDGASSRSRRPVELEGSDHTTSERTA